MIFSPTSAKKSLNSLGPVQPEETERGRCLAVNIMLATGWRNSANGLSVLQATSRSMSRLVSNHGLRDITCWWLLCSCYFSSSELTMLALSWGWMRPTIVATSRSPADCKPYRETDLSSATRCIPSIAEDSLDLHIHYTP